VDWAASGRLANPVAEAGRTGGYPSSAPAKIMSTPLASAMLAEYLRVSVTQVTNQTCASTYRRLQRTPPLI
jgi:hypothetical protein